MNLQTIYPTTTAETAASVVPIDPGFEPGDVRRYGASTGSIDNYAALQNALDVARQGGGTVYLPGLYDYQGSSSLVIYQNTVLRGKGVTSSGIRYTGTSHIDVLTVDPAMPSDVGMLIRDLQLSGGVFQNGRARYSFYATRFGRGCVLRNVWLREALGTLYIDRGHYSQMDNVLCGPTVPTESASGATSLQYNAVYATTAGSFFFLGNHARLGHLTFSGCVADNDNGASSPKNAIFLSGSALQIDSISVESLGGVPDNVMKLSGGRFRIDSFYAEGVTFTNYFVLATGALQASINTVSVSDINGNTIVQHTGTGVVKIESGAFSKMDVSRIGHVVNSGLGLGSDIVFENVEWASGRPVTDATVNGDSGNVFDTVNDTYRFGATEGVFPATFYAPLTYPRKIVGLSVTSSSDGDGHYVQIAGGVFLSEQGTSISVKSPTTEPDTTNLAVYRLRPQTPNRWYEVMVGRAGNLYLIESVSEPSSWRGNKLAEFQTNGSSQITGLTDNPLLTVRGQYTPGTNHAIFYVVSAPTSTDKRYRQGDIAIHEDAASAEPAFWMFDGSSWLTGPGMV